MSGRNGIFGYGLERAKGVPDRTTTFTPFESESLKMDRPPEDNPNLDPSGDKAKGELLRATGAGSVQGATDSESWLPMRANHHRHYEPPALVTAGVYLWELRSFASGDVAIDHWLGTLWFRVWRDQQTNPREYVGMHAVVTDFELSVDAHKFAMYKHDLLFLRDRYMSNPVEVAVNAAYTGDWVSRGHRKKGAELGVDLYYEVSTAGAIGVAKIKMGQWLSLSITSVGTTATAVSTKPHGLITGDSVTVSGAVEPEFNVTDTVTVINSTTFTYDIVAVGGAPATGTPVAKALGATEYTIVDGWMEMYDNHGARVGTRREPVQIRPTPQTGDLFTLGDSWRVPTVSAKPVPVAGTNLTERQRLTGTDMELSFEIDGVAKTIVIAKSFTLTMHRPGEAKEGLGSKYLQDIGEPADAAIWWEASFPRDYVDMDFEQALVSDSTISVTVKLWGTPIGATGYEDFAEFTLENMSISAAGATITTKGDLPETVTLRSFPVAGTPLCVEKYQNTIASIEPV